MAKLRHIAITVPDPEATAKFYEETLEMKRVFDSKFGVMMSDGVVSLAILHFPDDKTAGDERGKDFCGLHHMGFVVDDIKSTGDAVEANGGRFHMGIPSNPNSPTEQKYRDPNGIVFDLVTEQYANNVWCPKPK